MRIFSFWPLRRRGGTIRSVEDASSLGLPVLGSIAEFEPRPGARLPDESHPEALEAYQRLTEALRGPDFHVRGRAVVVTSALPGAGKSTTAKNLATLLARGGSRVILVDADINRVARRRPGDCTSSSGFAGLLVNQLMRPANALVHTLDMRLKLLPAGSVAGSADSLMRSPRLPHVVEALRELADYVIFDVAPLSEDLTALTGQADVTLLLLQAGSTPRRRAQRAIAAMRGARGGRLGLVLNRAPIAAAAPVLETAASPVEEAAELPGATQQRLEIAVDDLLADLQGALKLIRDVRLAGRPEETERDEALAGAEATHNT